MFKLLCLAAALAAPIFAIAQQANTSSPTSFSADPQKAASVRPVFGMLKEKTEGSEWASDFCRLDSAKTLPAHAMVVVVRQAPCISRYGATFNKTFLEVLFSGKKRLVPSDAVFMTDEGSERFDGIEPTQVVASAEEWKLASLAATQAQLEEAMNALKATSKHNIALLKASIFDVSEYTEGTGFKVSFYNSGKKTIKYVTFTVVGLNAVNDPVRGFLRGNTAPMLRGIGPIEPGETASYSKDYMWMTDVVESFRISQIKLEFTDGTSKVLTDMKSLRISEQDYEMLTADSD